MKIYAMGTLGRDGNIESYFLTREKARAALRLKHDEIVRRFATMDEETPDRFRFHLEWQGGATWAITEINVEE